jgi:hypothetical protein
MLLLLLLLILLLLLPPQRRLHVLQIIERLTVPLMPLLLPPLQTKLPPLPPGRRRYFVQRLHTVKTTKNPKGSGLWLRTCRSLNSCASCPTASAASAPAAATSPLLLTIAAPPSRICAMASVGDTAACAAEEGDAACFGIWPAADGDCRAACKALLPLATSARRGTGARGEGRAGGGLEVKWPEAAAAGGRDGPTSFSRMEYLQLRGGRDTRAHEPGGALFRLRRELSVQLAYSGCAGRRGALHFPSYFSDTRLHALGISQLEYSLVHALDIPVLLLRLVLQTLYLLGLLLRIRIVALPLQPPCLSLCNTPSLRSTALVEALRSVTPSSHANFTYATAASCRFSYLRSMLQ